jgi:SAM-dependent methyltransferase/uncharacterized protein YbaR (Trm112 family)
LRRGHFEAQAPVCPVCSAGGLESVLELATVGTEESDHVVEGILRCSEPSCLSEYPILDGIPYIVPRLRELVARDIAQLSARDDLSGEMESLLGDCCGPGSTFDTTRQQLSSYGWDHWADLDPEEPESDPGWAPGSLVRLLEAALLGAGDLPPGPILDLGCSVGRSTFELAGEASDPVVGVDLNVAMLRLAARALRNGRVRYPRRRAGLVYDLREFAVDPPGAERVDFWACDAAALPFAAGRFGLIVGLNFLDSAHSPLDALTSIERALAPGGKALLACPYDWAAGATPVESWIGGHSQRGQFEGSPEAVLRALLTPGAHPASLTGLRILAEESNLPWRVRLHDRGAVEYRCHLIVVEKMLGKEGEAAKAPPGGRGAA